MIPILKLVLNFRAEENLDVVVGILQIFAVAPNGNGVFDLRLNSAVHIPDWQHHRFINGFEGGKFTKEAAESTTQGLGKQHRSIPDRACGIFQSIIAQGYFMTRMSHIQGLVPRTAGLKDRRTKIDGPGIIIGNGDSGNSHHIHNHHGLAAELPGLGRVLHKIHCFFQKAHVIPTGVHIKARFLQRCPCSEQKGKVIGQRDHKALSVPDTAIHDRLMVWLPVETVRPEKRLHICENPLAHQLLHIHDQILHQEHIRSLPSHDLCSHLLVQFLPFLNVFRFRLDQFHLNVGIQLPVTVQRQLDHAAVPQITHAENRQPLVRLWNRGGVLPDVDVLLRCTAGRQQRCQHGNGQKK